MSIIPSFSFLVTSCVFLLPLLFLLLIFVDEDHHHVSAISVLSGNMNFDQSWISSSVIEWNMSSPLSAGKYFAVSVQGSGVSSGMAGLGVGCQQPASGTTTTVCQAITTTTYGASQRTDNSLAIVSAWTDASNAYVQVRLDPTAMGLSSSESRSVLVAIGTWSGGVTKHSATTDRARVASVSFTAPPTTSSTTTSTTSTTLEPTNSTTTDAPTTNATTSSTSASPPTTTTSVQSNSYLSGNLNVGWTLEATRVTFTLDTPLLSNHYGAVATSSSAMASGLGVACLMPTASTSASCSAFTTSNYGVGARTDASLVVDSSWTTASRAYVTVTVDASLMGITAGSAQRMIFARGAWNSGLPSKHASTADRGAATVTFVDQATTTTVESTSSTTSASSSSTNAAVTTSSTTTPTMTTTGPTSSTTPSPSTTTPSFSSTYLSGNLGLGYTWNAVSQVITWTLDTPIMSNHYAAVATSASAMGSGLGVACLMPTSTTAAVCVPFTTSNYGVGTRVDASLSIVSSSVTSTRAYVTVSLSASSMGISTAGDKRVIFSVGAWNTARKLPTKHAASADRSAATITFTAESSSADSTTASGPTQSSTTMSVSSTAATTSQSPSTSTTTNTVNVLSGNLVMNWEPVTVTEANLTITIESKTSSTFSAVGWSTGSGMAGKAIACVFPSVSTGSRCVQGDTSNYGFSMWSTQQHMILSSEVTDTATGAWKIKVTFPKASMAIESNASASSQKMIFAQGTFSTTTFAPTGHLSSNRAAANVNLYTGTTSDIEKKLRWRYPLVLAISFVYVILIGLIGHALKDRYIASTPVIQAVVMLSLFALFIGAVFASREDLVEYGKPHPFERAVGSGVGLLFGFLLIPTNKHFNIASLAGSSYERAINFHAICGITIFIMTIVHMSLMLSSNALTFDTIGNSALYAHPPLPAFIALILMGLMMFSGFARRKFYALFRVIHLLFIPVLILVLLHAPVMIVPMIPGGVLWLIDKIYLVFYGHKSNLQVKLAEYDGQAKVTHLKIQRASGSTTPVLASQFAFVSIPGAASIPRPFTICAFDEKNNMFTFLIRSIGPATRAIGEAAKKGEINQIVMTAPVGRLTVPLTGKHATSKTVFLCSGGIGITPSINICNYLAREIASGRLSAHDNPISQLNLVWSVREESLAETVTEIFQEQVASVLAGASNILANGGMQMSVNFSIYMTKGSSSPKKSSAKARDDNDYLDQELNEIEVLVGGPSARQGHTANNSNNLTSSSSPCSIQTIYGERPNFGKLFSASYAKNQGSTVSVFSCGPVPFMESVKSAAKANDCLLHEETFEM